MTIQQAAVTITGYVGRDPIRLGQQGATPVCTFRLASTRSHFDANTRQWRDHPTTWISVKAYRNLANNVLQSVHKGDPLLVTGLLNTEEWMREGQRKSQLVLEAAAIGHDLSRGTDQFVRNRPSGAATQPPSSQTAEAAVSEDVQRDDGFAAEAADSLPRPEYVAQASRAQTSGD